MSLASQSQNYQWQFRELLVSDKFWNIIDNYSSVAAYGNRLKVNSVEEAYILDLEFQLQQEMWNIIITKGTPLQIEVATYVLQGLTQQEIANKYHHKNQTNICKLLKGTSAGIPQHHNYDGKHSIYYGGLRQKIIKHIKVSHNIQQLMKAIFVSETDYHTPHYHAFQRSFDNFHTFTSWLEEVL